MRGGAGKEPHDDVVDLAEEILVDGYEPARVVVRVRHQVHIQLTIHNAVLGVLRVVNRRGAVLVGRGERVRGLAPRLPVLVFPPGLCEAGEGRRKRE